ncbi:Heat shock 70 kDa protein [Hondaea fermentalgiana]|uniref:Heat shock 70 kDa protein n=1 Tax=Hondaea fermentalgiana TaxID=2315210 RepID=A0A2R5G4F2_9STRA|nr:Heat shock 70 kDa protein [Hondaea fermentalgiana]|eukprot:GBG25435.1 Heat shock 70 kDa protein [Hondaea fermentalgiana]
MQHYEPQVIRQQRPVLVNTHVVGDKRVQLWHEQRPAFDGHTTSRDVYHAHPLEAGKRGVAPPGNLCTDKNSKFYGSTTSKESYIEHRIEAPARSCTEEKFQPSNARFYGTTTSAEAYIPHSVGPAKSLAPVPAERPNLPFYGTTTSRETYQPHAATAPSVPSSSARDTHISVGTGSQFYGDTTAKNAYGAPGAHDPTKPIVPAGKSLEGVLSTNDGTRFQGESTSRGTFVAHDIQPRVLPASIAWEPNKAYFYGTTTNADSYPAHLVQPMERNRGPSHSAVTNAPFQSATESRERFMAPGNVEPVRATHPVGNLHVDHAHFQGTSTSQDTFRGWQLPVQRLPVGLETVNDVFHVMIPERQRLPAEHAQVFTTVTDGQTSVQITVRQGISGRASENTVLASFELVGIDPAACGSPQILVTFSINEHSRLHIDAVDKITGKAQHIAIDRDINASAFN